MSPVKNYVNSFLKKLKTELSCDPAIPLLGINEGNEITVSERYLHPMFTAALFSIAKT